MENKEEMDRGTLELICYMLYCNGLGNRKGGNTLVYDLANTINDFYYEYMDEDDPVYFDECSPCDAETPRYRDSCCLICGQ